MKQLKEIDWRYLWVASPIVLYSIAYTIMVRIFDHYNIVQIPFDTLIPFDEWFVLFYISWFIYIVLILWFFFTKDKNTFIKTTVFMICGAVLTILIGLFYPNTNTLRPTAFAHHNMATWIVNIVYSIDPPRMILPSIHVYYVIGLSIGTWKSHHQVFPQWARVGIVLWGIFIIFSTMLIKQHSIVDALLSFAIGLIVYQFVFKGRFSHWIDQIEPPGSSTQS